ncbi:Bug family tripartite tricarboxylate transporter substrate binding protein [Pelagibius marinus]|uniref:Bug family tripartite tricarboxylate transporter substrate binding protein n=1 Tax=Pelagibius marinus TaxID=2762760 RepID=UPI0018731C1F|nr:tripartite tricarboxylate transporter substrate-binding protein [Pelagibius marinus]
MFKKCLQRALAALFALCALAAPAGAETAAEFYKGKVVKLVVGYSAGGGYDAYARLLAPHLESRLGAQVVVENRPGGGGNLALNQVVAGKPDGLTIMLIGGATASFSQVLEAPGVRFQMGRLGFLGRVADEKRVLLMSEAAGIGSLEEMLNAQRPIRFGGTARTATIGAGTAFIAEALGLEAQIIVGYKGSKEIALAAIRGEIDGFIPSDSSARRYGKEEGLKPLAVLSRERSSLMPDVPTFFELAELTPEQAWWIDYSDALFGLGRPLVTTPDIPADRLAFLQQVTREVLTDPAVIAEAQAAKRPISYLSPEAVKQSINRVMDGLTDEELARVRHVALEKFQ